MQCLALDIPAQIEWLHIWVATVIYETGLVAVKHTIYTQREELSIVDKLNILLHLFSL